MAPGDVAARAWRRPRRRGRAGAWIAGYVAYEAGYALEPKLAGLMPRRRRGPLLALGVFDAPQDAGAVLARGGARGPATPDDRA